jgi:UDP-GlcNAc:undecaprenyl-phosphate/decaprenyl-phosphate GlcNAc-1-phosphate transferase
VSWSPALTAGLAAAAARVSYRLLGCRPPGGDRLWVRANHRGRPVTLLEGAAVTTAAVTAAVLAPGLPGRQRCALALAGLAAGGAGCLDDLAGGGDHRGFRGHVAALAHGRATTGLVKLAGIGAAGLAASALIMAPGRRAAGSAAADLVINTGLAAGAANLINLFDLRPGRAIKVSLLAAAALAASAEAARVPAAAPAGAALALLPDDLGERSMLGDAGANALGAMLGVSAAAALPRPARLAVLAAIATLTVASERVSFTKVIARSPALNWLDMLGRRRPAAR